MKAKTNNFKIPTLLLTFYNNGWYLGTIYRAL